MAIHTVLFDADGVLQHPAVRWRTAFAPILGTTDPARLEPFLQEVLEAETNALCAPDGFDDALAQVLDRWNRSGQLSEALRTLCAVEIYEDVMHVVRLLQRAGVKCHIASNQQAGRARHMSEVLHYRTLFTREFYSCSLGVAKPDVTFFERVLDALGVSAGNVLFLDDREENVDAARRVGLAAAVYAGDTGAPALHRILDEHGLRVL